jgi:hypothetical protein
MAPQVSVEWHSRILRAWHLALLRFAITLDHTDRMNVVAIAKEIDRGGRARDERADFSFFRKTSADLCTSILQQNEHAGTILRQYLARIEDARLKRAFASAIDLNQVPAARKPEKDKKKDRNKDGNDGLWRGLAPRGDIRSRAC